MAERKQCEFFLVRYVPDTIRDEFVNIGVLLQEASSGHGTSTESQMQLRFTRDWSRVRCVDPMADVAMLEGLESEMRRSLSGNDLLGWQLSKERAGEGEYIRAMMKALQDSFSNAVQITGAKACLAESMPAELEQLMRMYVEPRKSLRLARRRGRAGILTRMRSQFDRVGVWDLMHKRIAAATYTRPGDPLRIDCGYRPNGLVRMFHAVSLDGDSEMAKILAFGASTMRTGMLRLEKAELELTAVIEPLSEINGASEDEERLAQYRFAVETMEEQAIRVLTTSDLVRVAETARHEMKV